MSKETKMEQFLRELEDTCGLDNQSGIQAALSSLPRIEVEAMALRWVMVCIAKRERSQVRKVERASTTSTTMHESVAGVGMPATPIKRTVGGRDSSPTNWKNPHRMAKWEFEQFKQSPEYEPWLQDEREFEAQMEERNKQFWGKINAAVEDLKTALRVEWTNELLESNFNLSDGTTVSWGTATVDQHRERYEMFMNNAVANAEGAARHKQAIEDLENHGAATLLDLAPVAA